MQLDASTQQVPKSDCGREEGRKEEGKEGRGEEGKRGGGEEVKEGGREENLKFLAAY